MQDFLLRLWLNTNFWIKILFVLLVLIMYPREGIGIERNIIELFKNLWENQSFGYTNSFQRITVEEEIKRYFPLSLKVIIPAFLLSIFLGVLKGVYDYKSAYKKRGAINNALTWLFQSLPDFFLVLTFQFFFIKLYIWGYPSIPVYGHSEWYSFIVPAFLLSVYPTLYLARITEAALHTEEKRQYLQVARAKGIPHSQVLFKHALGNCWPTIISHFTSAMLYILSNLFIIEYLMFYNGAAYRIFKAIGLDTYNAEAGFRHYDPPVIFGFILCFMLIVLTVHILSRLAIYLLDVTARRGFVHEK